MIFQNLTLLKYHNFSSTVIQFKQKIYFKDEMPKFVKGKTRKGTFILISGEWSFFVKVL